MDPSPAGLSRFRGTPSGRRRNLQKDKGHACRQRSVVGENLQKTRDMHAGSGQPERIIEAI